MRVRRRNDRDGFVLISVLLVVVLLSLAAYQYSELMIAESRAQGKLSRVAEARALADSGLHYAAAILASPDVVQSELNGNPYDNAGKFHQISLTTSDIAARQGRFSLVAVDDSTDATGDSLPTRHGVTDESGKINLNALALIDPTGTTATEILLKLPNMTEEIANSILDWIDADEEVRTSGAESQYYSARQPSYRCKNSPLDSVEELLLVKGVTPELLYGNDRNRNGVLDADEDDGAGQLDRGWLPYITVYSREANVDTTGAARMNLNDSNLQTLYTNLQAVVTPDLANYILAYRLYDTVAAGNPPPSGSQPATASSLSTRLQKDVASGKAKRSIKSIFDLIDGSVSIAGSGRDSPTQVIPSPLKDVAMQRSDLPILLDKTSTKSDAEIPARININTAPPAVLRALPGLEESEVQAIIDRRPGTSGFESADPVFESSAWLLTDANIPAAKMKALEPYITTTTQVYSVQSVGYFDEAGPMVRLEAVIDVNQGQPRFIFYRDLTELGRAYNFRE